MKVDDAPAVINARIAAMFAYSELVGWPRILLLKIPCIY